jgi:hypothetical protein
MMIKQVFPQHDKDRPHASLPKREEISTRGWNFLPHSPYSPDFSLSDFQPFDPLEEYTQTKPFCEKSRAETQRDCRALTLQQSCKRPTYSFSHKGGKIISTFEDVPMICLYNYMYSFCEKIGGITFVMPCLLVQIQCRYNEEIFISYLDSTAPFLFLFIPFPHLFHSS